FSLTGAEAAVALDLLSGEGLKASARRLGISLETARTHLRHIFAKTGARRQAELVRLILSARHPIRL
ncbi:MAG: helix-turn-helix transcriptional regulator, partial [Methylobacteriaceae bacterium]|nr:helix-turn-helix transcriptional regulator [Methylobacteriaceae bacterium]